MIDIFYSDRFLLHDTGFGHPESPERLKAIVDRLREVPYANHLSWHEPDRIPVELLGQVHSTSYIEEVSRTAQMGGFSLDPDTYISLESYDVALQSAGAWTAAVDSVLDNKRSAFVLSRPPGHHAERNHSAGFCLFANCALAATYALEERKVSRIAILDWDVHHGNGTQHILETERRASYASLHQWPFFPGTGASHETGDYHNVLNIPLPAGSGRSVYMKHFEDEILPFLRAQEPELLLVSAGFDASLKDPIGSMNLTSKEFAQFTEMILDLRTEVLFGLEGGYHLQDLAECVDAVLETVHKQNNE